MQGCRDAENLDSFDFLRKPLHLIHISSLCCIPLEKSWLRSSQTKAESLAQRGFVVIFALQQCCPAACGGRSPLEKQPDSLNLPLFEVDHTNILIGFGVVGLEGDRLLLGGNCCTKVTLSLVNQAEIVMGDRHIRLNENNVGQ